MGESAHYPEDIEATIEITGGRVVAVRDDDVLAGNRIEAGRTDEEASTPTPSNVSRLRTISRVTSSARRGCRYEVMPPAVSSAFV